METSFHFKEKAAGAPAENLFKKPPTFFSVLSMARKTAGLPPLTSMRSLRGSALLGGRSDRGNGPKLKSALKKHNQHSDGMSMLSIRTLTRRIGAASRRWPVASRASGLLSTFFLGGAPGGGNKVAPAPVRRVQFDLSTEVYLLPPWLEGHLTRHWGPKAATRKVWPPLRLLLIGYTVVRTHARTRK